MTSDLLPVLASATTVVTDPIYDLHGQAHGFAVWVLNDGRLRSFLPGVMSTIHLLHNSWLYR